MTLSRNQYHYARNNLWEEKYTWLSAGISIIMFLLAGKVVHMVDWEKAWKMQNADIIPSEQEIPSTYDFNNDDEDEPILPKYRKGMAGQRLDTARCVWACVLFSLYVLIVLLIFLCLLVIICPIE